MESSRQIRYFFFSQYLADGIRITLEIIIPTMVLSYFGKMETGLLLSLGALCVSIADGPGPVIHKRNGMFACNIFIFISALLTGLLNHNMLLLGALILVSSFLFTMFSVYGNRATAVGFAALLIMILQMSRLKSPQQVFDESLLIVCGGIWYTLVALIFYRITPYRPAQRSLGDCIHETAEYLLIKSELYNPSSNLQDQYRKLLDQQVIVNEKQDTVRELLFKNRSLLKESTHSGRLLVLTFVDVVDLFEYIMASWYDYSLLRNKYANTGVLNDISLIVKNISYELDGIGESIQSNSSFKKEFDLVEELNDLKKKIDSMTDTGSTIMLKKILVNLRNLGEKIDGILKYFNEDISTKGKLRSQQEYSRFVTHQKINLATLKNNLNFGSSIFRHALRVMIACGVGFFVSKLISTGHHSYWILMTIIIILKPAFSLTKRKNYDRLLGTIAGGIIGLLLLNFIQDKMVLFGLIVFFMLGTYTFKTLNYIVMVIFLTPYVLILFHFLGLGALDVASERLLDTAIGSALAFLASYFLFPQWESDQLRNYMASVLKANIHYLQKLNDLFTGKKILSLDYKLIRKELFVSTANLSAALHRMLSEPQNKQLHKNEIYEFVVLNHVLSSNVASLTAVTNINSSSSYYSREFLKPVRNSISILESSLQQLDNTYIPGEGLKSYSPVTDNTMSPDSHLNEQLNFVYKVSADIGKLTHLISI
ncbi:MAG: FUSC family membrane protein [Ginsengibacter sp.]